LLIKFVSQSKGGRERANRRTNDSGLAELIVKWSKCVRGGLYIVALYQVRILILLLIFIVAIL